MASPRRRTDAGIATPDRPAWLQFAAGLWRCNRRCRRGRCRSTTFCTRASASTSRPRSTCRRRCFRSSAGPTAFRRRWRARSGRSHSAPRVQAIEQPNGRVRVRYSTSGGALRQAEGAFCISTLPLTILRDVSLDAAPDLRAAIAAINYSSAGKIGLQFARRFWEEDDGIFGGISRTNQEITQILYPSTGYLSRKGVLVGYYHTGAAAGPIGDLAPAERLQRGARAGIADPPAVQRRHSRMRSQSRGRRWSSRRAAGRSSRKRSARASTSHCSSRTQPVSGGRLHDKHERLAVRCLRVRPRGRQSHPRTRAAIDDDTCGG